MAIVRPVTKTIISTTAFGVPVADAVNANTDGLAALQPGAWIAPTLLNGWVNFASGWQVVQYRKVGDRVEIRGMVRSGTVNQAIFTLPVGFRPIALMYFAGDSYGQHAPMVAMTDGTFKAEAVPNVANLSFNNIYYSLTP